MLPFVPTPLLVLVKNFVDMQIYYFVLLFSTIDSLICISFWLINHFFSQDNGVGILYLCSGSGVSGHFRAQKKGKLVPLLGFWPHYLVGVLPVFVRNSLS